MCQFITEYIILYLKQIIYDIKIMYWESFTFFFFFTISGMMDTVLGGTMGVLKHDVTMVTDMIDKYKGRTLPESNLPRNINSDGNVKNGTISSLKLQHIVRTPQHMYALYTDLGPAPWIFFIIMNIHALFWLASLYYAEGNLSNPLNSYAIIYKQMHVFIHIMILVFILASLKIKKKVLFLDGGIENKINYIHENEKSSRYQPIFSKLFSKFSILRRYYKEFNNLNIDFQKKFLISYGTWERIVYDLFEKYCCLLSDIDQWTHS